MARSLKDSYRTQLFAAVAANVALYYALANGLNISEFTTDPARQAGAFLPGGIAAALCGILNSQLTHVQKARIVFLRWRDPLPGCRAFSHYIAQDPRIDMKTVRAKWSPLPKGARQQNALWYRLYQQEQGSDAVQHLNRHWLFARDYASMCALLLITLGVLGVFQMPSRLSWSIFVMVVLAQLVITRRSAVNHAEQLVLTVVAQAAAKPN